jgi:hypothetical protein
MKAGKIDALRVEDRIGLLEAFLAEVGAWNIAHSASVISGPHHRQAVEDESRSRQRINRMVIAVKQALADVQIRPKMVVSGSSLDLFNNLFLVVHDQWVINSAAETVDQATGAYESLRRDDGLVRIETPQTLDLLTAIERALRPAFKDGPPLREREVQDEIETILRAVGADYHREVDAAAVGPTHFKPDFTVEAESLAIEVKLANDKHSAAAVQRELAEDVAAYGTKGKTTVFVVYDCGAIHDPEQFRRENQKHFGVRVLIVKH